MQKQKQDLQSEISRIQTLKNNEEDELHKLRQQKSEMEIYIFDLQSQRVRLEMDGQLHSEPEVHEPRNARDRIPLTDDHHKSTDFRFSLDYERRGEVDTPQNYHSSQPSLQSSHPLPNSYHVTSYNSETSINNSHFHTYHPHQQVVSSQTLSTNPLSSSTFYDEAIKEDNNVISLKRERSEIESQVCDMRIQLTRLQTEVTSLESRKTILETMHRNYAADELTTGLMNGHGGVGVDTDLDYDITRTITEVTKQFSLLTNNRLKFSR